MPLSVAVSVMPFLFLSFQFIFLFTYSQYTTFYEFLVYSLAMQHFYTL